MTYQEQMDLLLQNYIDFCANRNGGVEFIISSACDQKCEYCYLQKHGHEMNYQQANNEEDILRNLPIFLDYLDEINFQYVDYDIFSGEFFQLPYWEKVLQIFYDHQMKVKKKRFTTIPTNYSFIANDETTKRVEYWIEKMKECDAPLHLSCSIDGPEETDNKTRPNHKGIIKDEAFYDKVFKFLAKHNFACHPMISKYFLQDYKKNYDFFLDNTIKYNVLFYQETGESDYNMPMLLEVRDSAEWDEESLKLYKEFLRYVAYQDLEKLYNGDKEKYALKIFDDFTNQYTELTGHHRTQPYILAYPYMCGNQLSCSIQHQFVCRIGDLTLAPCHRTYYSQFEYGKLKLNEEKTKIIGVEGKNPLLAFKIAKFNPARSNLKCGGCKIKAFCLQGCLGSAFENTTEIFGVQDPVCEMFKVKYSTIHEIVEEMGLYEIILKNPLVPAERKEFIVYARKLLSNGL